MQRCKIQIDICNYLATPNNVAKCWQNLTRRRNLSLSRPSVLAAIFQARESESRKFPEYISRKIAQPRVNFCRHFTAPVASPDKTVGNIKLLGFFSEQNCKGVVQFHFDILFAIHFLPFENFFHKNSFRTKFVVKLNSVALHASFGKGSLAHILQNFALLIFFCGEERRKLVVPACFVWAWWERACAKKKETYTGGHL